MTPEADIVDALDAAGVGDAGVNLFEGPVRDGPGVPDAAVFAARTSGTLMPYLGGVSAPDEHDANIQVRVRSAVNAYAAGRAVADAARDALHKQAPAGYTGWWASEPYFIEQDQQDRSHWSINVRVLYDE